MFAVDDIEEVLALMESNSYSMKTVICSVIFVVSKVF